MKISRKKFIHSSLIAGSALGLNACVWPAKPEKNKPSGSIVNQPIVLSTWRFGIEANAEAWKILSNGGSALDAVEAGVKVPEADPKERSVGYGGRPDREGIVSLDACIMDHLGNIGSVVCLENIKHAISVARAVMEKTPHVMLAGKGAQQFALEQGFKLENLLVEESKKEWEEWLKKNEYKPIANIENHDTIGMLALDQFGNLSGACTTSGMAFKMRGRVGDSPIIGAGLYIDNEVGGATATGHGEEVIRIAGSSLVVELMRQGYSPENACKEAVSRVVNLMNRRNKNIKDIQVGFIALNKAGEYGSYCVQNGFNYALKTSKEEVLIDAPFHTKIS
ncbi:MAG: N(4)-(beta-N-acetylglucosaminyl)-L-asparaginase [Bacteroidia bacterium]|nr:N(4)-(beta-N-acetylglucosaminyl)-L-asparaginase [Bacteroidia bacterium]